MAAPSTYDWIKQYPLNLKALDDAPLLGYAPPFPWDQFSLELGKFFQSPDLSITGSEFAWRSPDQLVEGLGENLNPLYFNVSGLPGTVCWLLSENDIRHIMSLLLNQDDETTHYLDKEYLKGFYQFLTLETLQALGKIEAGKDLSPKPLTRTELPTEDSLSSDVTIHLRGKTFLGRLLLSPDFRKGWKEKYASRGMGLKIGPLGDKVNVTLHLEGGKTVLKRSEWKGVKTGDFLLLDLCTLDPDAEKGRVMITLNGLPLFRAKVKDGNIKILEHPLYSEDTAMANQPPKGFEEDEDLGDAELDAEFEAELAEGHAPAAAPAKAPVAPPAAGTPVSAAPKASGAPSIKTASGKSLSTEDIPLNIVVELGRVEISVQKLLELQPGNLLELNIRPEDGVDLVVSGRRIAKGELIKLGETLGVRILEIG